MSRLKESYRNAVLIVLSGFAGGLAARSLGDPVLERATEVVIMLVVLTTFIYALDWFEEKYWPDEE